MNLKDEQGNAIFECISITLVCGAGLFHLSQPAPTSSQPRPARRRVPQDGAPRALPAQAELRAAVDQLAEGRGGSPPARGRPGARPLLPCLEAAASAHLLLLRGRRCCCAPPPRTAGAGALADARAAQARDARNQRRRLGEGVPIRIHRALHDPAPATDPLQRTQPVRKHQPQCALPRASPSRAE